MNKLTFNTGVNLDPATRDLMVASLNTALADATALWSVAKNAHFNVKGMAFGPLHALFNEVADMAIDHADDLAERASQLGGYANGNVWDAAATSRLGNHGRMQCITGEQWLMCLAHCLTMYANAMRLFVDASGNAHDLVTQNLVVDMAQDADKMLWKVQSHLNG